MSAEHGKKSIVDLVAAKQAIDYAERFANALGRSLSKSRKRHVLLKVDFSSGIWSDDLGKVTCHFPSELLREVQSEIEANMQEIVQVAIASMRDKANRMRESLKDDVESLLEPI